MFPRRNSYARGKVIIWKSYADGNSVGRENNNPLMYTREYCVGFDDREVREMIANVIAEFMYDACDDSGNEYLMMESILDYQKRYKALSVSSQKVLHRGRNFMQQSKLGWKLCVQWRAGYTLWKSIKDLKESHPV